MKPSPKKKRKPLITRQYTRMDYTEKDGSGTIDVGNLPVTIYVSAEGKVRIMGPLIDYEIRPSEFVFYLPAGLGKRFEE